VTDYELQQLMGIWATNVAVWMIFLVGLLIAYLLTAYLSGRNLTRAQARILTALMLWFSFIIVAHVYAGFQNIIDARELASFGYTRLRRETAFQWLVTVGCALAPLACVNFMYRIRHPRYTAPVRRPTPGERPA